MPSKAPRYGTSITNDQREHQEMRQPKPAPSHRNQKTVDDLELYHRFHKRGEPSGESNQIESRKELFSKIWAGRHFSPLDPALP